MKKFLCDVDGVVADLMHGFRAFMLRQYGELIVNENITKFHIAKSPELSDIHARVNLDDKFNEFMADDDLYARRCAPIPGAIGAITELMKFTDFAFITATMQEVPESFAPKARWLTNYFPGCRIISCPSELKHSFAADFVVDDRYDTCSRFAELGCRAFVFRQPWNEAPEGFKTYDWPEIMKEMHNER